MITSAILLPIVFTVLGIIVAYLLITQVFIPLFNGQVLFPFLTESLASLQQSEYKDVVERDTYVFKVRDDQAIQEVDKSLLGATQMSVTDVQASTETNKKTKKTATKKSAGVKTTAAKKTKTPKAVKSDTKQYNKKPKAQKPAAIKPIAKKPTAKKATTTKTVKKSVKTSKAPQ
jgi:hypothetical protein